MKKVLKTLLVVTVLALVLTAFTGCELLDKIMGLLPSTECEHTGGTATCAAQAICEKCGEPYGEKLAHTPQTILEIHPTCTDAGRTEGSKCSVCGEIIVAPVEVAATGHDYFESGCLKTCLNCGDVVGEHTWADATCTEPKTCTECGKTDGKANGHKGGTATCTELAECEVCHEKYGKLAEHTEVEIPETAATCGTAGSTGGKKCSVCGTVTVEPTVVPATGKHTGGTATCKDKAVCTVCGQSYGELGEHKGGEATCQSKAVCDTCGEEYGELGEHKGGTATCTSKAVCDTCKEEYGKLAPHDHNGTNGACSMCGLFAFDADLDLSGYDRNDAIADGTTFVNGLITLNGGAKRSNSGNYSIELTKRGGSYFTFTIPEGMTANVKLVVSSTGSTNTSDFGIFDANGNAMENAEKTYTVSGSDEAAFNYALTAGTYKIMSPDGGSNSGRGVRVFEAAVELVVPPHVHDWKDATCTEPKTCTGCGATEGEAKGHTYVDGYCTCGDMDADYTFSCNVADLTSSDSKYLNHKVTFTGTVTKIKDAWNTDFNNMSVYVSDGNGNEVLVYRMKTKVELCDTVTITGEFVKYYSTLEINTGATAVIGEKNHIYAPATCTEPATCPCGQTTGEAKGHNYGEDGVCECGAKRGATMASVTIATYADNENWSNGTQYLSIDVDENITVTVSGGTNTGKYYTSGEQWRTYQNESPSIVVTAADGKKIVSVKITYAIKNTGVMTLNGENISSGTVVEVNESSVTFNVGNTGTATNGQMNITAIEVVYE